MKTSIAASNPYLQKPALKREMVKRFVASSSAIEGIHIKKNKKTIKIKTSSKRGKV